MPTIEHVQTPRGRRWSLRVAVTAGVLLLFALGAVPAVAGGAKGPQKIIFDLTATPSWTRTFHGPGAAFDSAGDVVMTSGGVTYVAGTMRSPAGNPDASLMKLVNGVPSWPAPKLYDSPYHDMDSFTAMALGPGNTVYTAGASMGANGMPDILIVKWSSSGAVKWAKRYDGPGHGVELPNAMVVDSAGNVTVGGYSVGASGADWVVVNWSASGVRRWTSRYGASAPHEIVPNGIVVASDRSVYASGVSLIPPTTAAMTVKYSPAGKVLWKKTYAGPAGLGAVVWAAVARPGGGVYVCGSTLSAATSADGLVMSYTSSGTRDVLALDTGPGGASQQSFEDLTVTSTHQVVAVGSSTAGGNEDLHAATYTVDGTIAGQATLPGAWEDEFVAVASDAFGGFYATGRYHTAVNKTAIFTARGSVLTGGGGFWSLWQPAFVSDDNEPNAIAVRGTTAVVVGEASEGAAQGVDQVVLGYVY
jgi:hypothetical protein